MLLCGGLLVLMHLGGELHLPLLVRGRLPVLVGARLLPLLLQKQADIGLLRVVLLMPMMLLVMVVVVVVVVLRLLVGG
jgi:hypothetical protein